MGLTQRGILKFGSFLLSEPPPVLLSGMSSLRRSYIGRSALFVFSANAYTLGLSTLCHFPYTALYVFLYSFLILYLSSLPCTFESLIELTSIPGVR